MAGVVRDEVVAATGAAARVEVTDAEKAAAAPVGPAVVATAVVADLMAAVGDATGGATSGRSAPRRRAPSSSSVRCSGIGHEESTCPSDAAMLAMELPMSEEDLAMGAHAYVAKETGKCRVIDGEEVGVES